jgi:LPXTG-site transpeptidase (sortase) family protein
VKKLENVVVIMFMLVTIALITYLYISSNEFPVTADAPKPTYFDEPHLVIDKIKLNSIIDTVVPKDKVKKIGSRPTVILLKDYLVNIGDPGVSLIMGHRQWLNKPLVFAYLDKLSEGSEINVYHKSFKLTYRVTCVKIIEPWEIWQVITDSAIPGSNVLVLMTCAPYGKNTHRLVVTAELSPGINTLWKENRYAQKT